MTNGHKSHESYDQTPHLPRYSRLPIVISFQTHCQYFHSLVQSCENNTINYKQSHDQSYCRCFPNTSLYISQLARSGNSGILVEHCQLISSHALPIALVWMSIHARCALSTTMIHNDPPWQYYLVCIERTIDRITIVDCILSIVHL